MKADRLLIDCHVATMVKGLVPYGAIQDAAVVIADGRIAWVGPRADLPAVDATETERLDGRWITPGLIDCHVHTHHSEVYVNRLEAVPLTLMMARSAGRLKRMLEEPCTA